MRKGRVLSTLGFFGRIVTFVGAGAMLLGEQDGGDAERPLPSTTPPPPLGAEALLCLLHNISTFEREESGAL